MKQTGDKIVYEGKVGVITSTIIPRCKCKRGRYYIVDINGTELKLSVRNTKIEEYIPGKFIYSKPKNFKHNVFRTIGKTNR